jgi:hypothetical protein
MLEYAYLSRNDYAPCSLCFCCEDAIYAGGTYCAGLIGGSMKLELPGGGYIITSYGSGVRQLGRQGN